MHLDGDEDDDLDINLDHKLDHEEEFDDVDDLDDDVGDVDYEADYGCSEEEFNEAVKQGWNPDFQGKNPRTAREYLDRTSFFKKIDAQNKNINQLKSQVQFFMDRAEAAEQTAREELKTDLKEARKDALRDEDYDRVQEIDDELLDIRDEERDAKNKKKTDVDEEDDNVSEPSEGYNEWLTENKWYDSASPAYNKKLHKIADTIAKDYIDEYGEPEDEDESLELLDHVSKEIKTRYKEHFMNKKRQKPSSVEGDTKNNRRKKSTSKSKHSVGDLDPQEQVIMRNMIAKGQIESEDAYLSQLEESGFFSNK